MAALILRPNDLVQTQFIAAYPNQLWMPIPRIASRLHAVATSLGQVRGCAARLSRESGADTRQPLEYPSGNCRTFYDNRPASLC